MRSRYTHIHGALAVTAAGVLLAGITVLGFPKDEGKTGKTSAPPAPSSLTRMLW